jgi:D-alanyl-D-alanine carboxypeptidase
LPVSRRARGSRPEQLVVADLPTAGVAAAVKIASPHSTVRTTTLGSMVAIRPALSFCVAVLTTTVASSSPAATTGPPAFARSVSRVTAADLPYSYRPGCPVGPDRLRLLRLRYWGFDGKPHVGSLVVNVAVVSSIGEAFRRLYTVRFPIRRMDLIDAFHGSDSASTRADNTSAFNCRFAVANGARHWSMHAYGEAIDVNPVENPYVLNGKALPPAGAGYADRSRVRPGMAVAGGTLVRVFAAAGWSWGGNWAGSPDYQHFSTNGR